MLVLLVRQHRLAMGCLDRLLLSLRSLSISGRLLLAPNAAVRKAVHLGAWVGSGLMGPRVCA